THRNRASPPPARAGREAEAAALSGQTVDPVATTALPYAARPTVVPQSGSAHVRPVRSRRSPRASARRANRVDELERDDELRRVRGADRLQRVEVLEAHRLLVEAVRDLVDLREREREALGSEDRGLAVALGRKDR